VFAYHIVVKARSLIDAQQAADPARNAANHAADRATNGPAYRAAFGGAARRASGNALSLGREGRANRAVTTAIPNLFCIVISPLFSVERRAKHRPSSEVPRRAMRKSASLDLLGRSIGR
jgi:hypothetical protein